MPLTDCLEHENRRGYGNIQRIHLTQHRYFYMGICMKPPERRKSLMLSTHDDGCAASHVSIIVPFGILKLGCIDTYLVIIQPL